MNILVPNWKLNMLIPYGYNTPDVRPSIKPWWRHQMKTFSALLAMCAGNTPGHKVQRRGALIFSLIGVWINGWVNNREAGDLRRYRAHHDFIGNCNARLIITTFVGVSASNSAPTSTVAISTVYDSLDCYDISHPAPTAGIFSWWRHQMETFSALLGICAGNSPVPGEFPAQRPVTRRFGVFFNLRLNKRLSKQSWGYWFETLSCSLWRHRNVTVESKGHDYSTLASCRSISDKDHYASMKLLFIFNSSLHSDVNAPTGFG